MQKRKFLVPTLSAVILSTVALSQKAYADEADQASVASGRALVTNQLEVSTEEQTRNTDESSTQGALVTSEATGSDKGRVDEKQEQGQPTEEAQQAPAPADSQKAAAQETATAASKSSSQDITIIHTNDVHGRMVEDEKNGVIGDAKLASLVKQSRAQGETLVFDAGDVFQGLPISNSSKGEAMADILNTIGYDAMTLGNHEFDFGLYQLKRLQEKLNFPIISSNVYVNGARLFEASTIIDKNPDVTGDEFVVIGVTTPETATKTHPNNVAGVSFTDPITEVNQVIAQTEAYARAQGKDYHNYVILAHLGVDATTKKEWQGLSLAQALAQNPELKGKNVIVIDGHSHTVLQVTNGNVTYNQTGSYLNNIGLIKLNSQKVLSAGVITAEQAKALKPDETVAKLVAKIESQYEAQNAQVIRSDNPVEFNGDRMNVRVRQTNLGDLVTDALLAYSQTGFSHPSNLAVTNGGGLRQTLKKGQPITKGDITAVLPFGNRVAQIQVTGQDIYHMFAKSLGSIVQKDSAGHTLLDDQKNPLLEPSGGFLQVAGARVYYDSNLPASQRILGIEIWDPETDSYKSLDLTKTYYLTTNDFLAAGGDAYTMLGGPREEGPSMDQVLEDYLKSGVDLTKYAEVNPNNRIISIDAIDYFARHKLNLADMERLIEEMKNNFKDATERRKIIDAWKSWTNKGKQDDKNSDKPSGEQKEEQTNQTDKEVAPLEQEDFPSLEEEALPRPTEGLENSREAERPAQASPSESAADASPVVPSDLQQSAATASGSSSSADSAAGKGNQLAAGSQSIGNQPEDSSQGHVGEVIVSVLGLTIISAGAVFDHFRPKLRKPK